MSIRLSPQHGVNPSLLKCPVCGEDSGVALVGRLKDDAEAPRHMLDQSPCSNCQDDIARYKEKGFVLFAIRETEYDEARAEARYENRPEPSPWFFFHKLYVITQAAAKMIFPEGDRSQNCAFIAWDLAKQIGLENIEPTHKEI